MPVNKGSSSADSPSSIITCKRLLEEDVNELEYLLGADGRISELHAILDQRPAVQSWLEPHDGSKTPFLLSAPAAGDSFGSKN